MTTVRRAAHRVTTSAIAALAALALAAGCSNAVAGAPTGVSAGGTSTGTSTRVPVDPPPQCKPTAPKATRPTADSEQLLRLGSMSAWSPPWTQQASVIIYSDGTAVAPHVERKGASSGASTPAGPAQHARPGLNPLSGGWIDRCELEKLLHRAKALSQADTGKVTNVMDASSAWVWIAAGDERPEISLSVYALGMGDDDNSGLTADQEAARRELSAWISDVRHAVQHTGPMPLDRLLLHEPDTGNGRSGANTPARWTGEAPAPTRQSGSTSSSVPPCQVLTGAAAANAVRNVERSGAVNPDRRSSIGMAYWGAFTVDGQTRHFVLLPVAPGQDCG